MPASSSILVLILAAILVLALLGWLLNAKALRVDRLHRQVLGARATLESQLVHRAQAALDLAACQALDPASATLLSQAAREAMASEAPVVDDGLDPEHRATGAIGQERVRAQVESDLSRVLRAVLDAETRAELEPDPIAASLLERLDRCCYRLVLARRFHDTHVSETLRIRTNWDVRLFHLAGHAPSPGTFDVDDETTPNCLPASEEKL
ncbi:Uncharacterised protein [Actinomyces bovis]|uniref:LemA family n=1 Tax=Actinomyces bovis TaxID=1658 RepID=A0ABY1VPN6_9ACTO|nr:hypothetical protein [Actinomyces bovis]SPT54094.1 Uncharacterised protein [Actinomyces bovis]VEG53687.1 Uncharacterised protein [Actinomyces israelii]